MRVPTVLVDQSLDLLGPGDRLPLDEQRQHHLGRVLRRRDGDAVVLTDGRGRRAPATLAGAEVVLDAEVEVVAPQTPAVEVVHALPKGRGLDEVVRTLAELGVAAVHPVLTARTESRPTGDRADRAAERWEAIARSAAEQAHSAHLMEVGTPVSIADWLADAPSVSTESPGVAGGARGVGLVADPAATTTLGDAIAAIPDLARVWLFVGPEGGFTDDEVERLAGLGWVPARAGDTVLRSVHAATVLVAATLALTGRYGGGGGGGIR